MSVSLDIYIAAPLAQSWSAREWAELMRGRGHHVVSTWHDVVGDGAVEPDSREARSLILSGNLDDLEHADVVLAIMSAGRPRATLCELGWSLAKGTPVIWFYGDTPASANIFDSHSLSIACHTTSEVMCALSQIIAVNSKAAE